MRPPQPGRVFLLAFAVAGAALASGCHKEAQGPVQVVVLGDPPEIVEPSRGPLDTGESVLLANTAQGLVRFDARGQIVPGLAETWAVSDDGMSYIFRLATTTWPNGDKVTAEQVARMLRRQLSRSSRNPLKDSLGAVDDVVAMTDRVIEIRLTSPRPELLQLLAQPEMGLVYEKGGTGPFSIDRDKSKPNELLLTREVTVGDQEQKRRDQVTLAGSEVLQAINSFKNGAADLVLGGRFVALPRVRAAGIGQRSIRFDPASGLFGLVPARADGLIADPVVRQLLSQAIDRDALVAALGVPGLLPRATVLEPGLAEIPDPTPPAWTNTPLADRRPALAEAARQLITTEKPTIRIFLPDGPGANMLLDRLRQDWGFLGISVDRAEKENEADLKLVDEVAPSTSPSWFLRSFRCGAVPICDETIDQMLESARVMPVEAQRTSLLLDASRQMDALELFIPLAAPVRWSLVSARIKSFSGNRFARHPLTNLEQPLDRGD